MGALGIMNFYFCLSPERFGSEEVSLVLDGECDWSKKLQGLVMGSYYWGFGEFKNTNFWYELAAKLFPFLFGILITM